MLFIKPVSKNNEIPKQDLINKLIYGRIDYPPKMKRILNEYGNYKIVDAELNRYIVPFYLNIIANALTFGEFSKNNPYDKLFHLSIILTLDNGAKILLEKNEVINAETSFSQPNDTEKLHVNIPFHFTFKEMLERTRNIMGNEKFFMYSAYDNNCQAFINNFLIANDLDTRQNIDFVKQDTEQLFKNLQNLRKLANTATDIAGRIDILKEGQGMLLGGNNALYSNQIEEELKNHPYFNGVYMKDELPKILKNGWYVMNMENSNQQGSHWVSFKVGNSLIEYYDSLSGPPPIEVMEKAKGNIIYNEDQIQNENSSACGYFCISIIKNDKSKGVSKKRFQKYLNKFSNNTLKNDAILSTFLKSGAK